MKKIILNLKNNKAFSIVMILVIIGIISVVSAGVITVAQQFLKMQNQNNHRMMATQIRNEFRKVISDQAAWLKTISNTTVNPQATARFACLANLSDCGAISNLVPQYDFVPIAITGTPYKGTYDPVANPNQGFTVDGQVCNTFAVPPAVATTDCAFRFSFKWSPDCTGYTPGACINPPVIISISFLHNPLPGIVRISSSQMDLNAIAQTFVRGFEFDALSLQSICAARGPGVTYNATTGRCNVPAPPAPVPVPVPVPVPIPVPGPPPCTTSSCSDIRVKKDIRPFTLGLSEVLQLKTMTYKYNGLAGSPNDDQEYTGVIAQELQVVAPVLVQERSGIKSVDYHGLSMMLVNSIQELNKRIETLEKENRILKEKK